MIYLLRLNGNGSEWTGSEWDDDVPVYIIDSRTDAEDDWLAREKENEVADGHDHEPYDPYSEDNDPCASSWGRVMCGEYSSCEDCPLCDK